MGPTTDLDLSTTSIASLTSGDGVAAFFTSIGYRTGVRKPLSAEAIGLAGDAAAPIREIELIDDQVGRMLGCLEETVQAENTVVIFMSDHGEMLGDHGIYMKGPHFYDEAIRVPLVIRWPGQFARGLQSDALVELVDLAPTLLQAAEVPIEPGIQGRSLLPICRGEADASHHRDFVFSEYYNAWTHRHAYGTMLRTRDEKLVVYHTLDEGELYDLQADPDEFENRWNHFEHPDYADRKIELLKRTFDASVLSMDPLPERLGEF